jgi:hypothetical protein
MSAILAITSQTTRCRNPESDIVTIFTFNSILYHVKISQSSSPRMGVSCVAGYILSFSFLGLLYALQSNTVISTACETQFRTYPSVYGETAVA